MDKKTQTPNPNELQANIASLPTFSFLGLNESSVVYEPPVDEQSLAQIRSSAPAYQNLHAACEALFTQEAHPWGISEQVLAKQAADRTHSSVIEITKSGYSDHVTYTLDAASPYLVDATDILVKEGVEANLVIEYVSEDELEVMRNSQIRVVCEKDAKFTLAVVQHLGNKARSLSSIASVVGDDAELNVVQIELGSAESFLNYVAYNEGDRGRAYYDCAYYLMNDQRLDMDLTCNQIGKKTDGTVMVYGVQQDQSHKVFKGTIDFRDGCSGATGDEKEQVMLLSDELVSRSIPFLLCTEEDCEGSHAVSAGSIEEEELFYLMSRGISRERATRMIAEGAIVPVIDKLPDHDLRDALVARIHDRIFSSLDA